MISITKTMRYPFLSSQISFLTLEEIQKQERTCSYKEISTLIKKLPEDWTGKDKSSKKNKKKENQIFFVAFMERLRKAKVFWLFKLPSSKHILHAGNQSPNLIQCWRVLLIIKEWFGRGQWRTTFSNKS